MAFETTNVAATVGQGVNPFDPLKTIGGLAATQNALNQNRLFQAQQAGGNAFLQSLGPNGQIDTAALGNNLTRANAGLVAPELAQAGATLAGTQLGQANTRVGALKSALASVAPPQTDDKGKPLPGENESFSRRYAATLKAGIAQGLWSSDDAANIAGGNVPGLSPSDVVRQAALQAGNPAQLKAQVGEASFQDVGGFEVPTIEKIGPSGTTLGVIPGSTPILKSAAPAVVSADTGLGTNYRAVTPVTGQSVDLGTVPNVKAANSEAYRYYDPADKTTKVVTVAQAAAHPPTGPITAEAPLGAAAAANAAGIPVAAQSGQYFADVQNIGGTAAQAGQAQLQELQSLLADPKVQTGPATPFLSKINALAQQFHLPIQSADDVKTRSALDVVKKLTEQIAQQQFRVIGGTGTDAKLMSAAHTSPDAMISSVSNQDIIPLLRGNLAAAQHIKAAADAWQAAGHGPETAPEFQARLAQGHYNPLVFQLQYMPKEERARIVNGLPKADQAKYQEDWIYNRRMGWVAP